VDARAWPIWADAGAVPRREVEIVNKLGLHARAAAKLTQVASAFKSEVWLSRNDRRVNAKSIMGVMMLAAGRGSRVVIETDGADAEAALEALAGLIDDRFGEGE
jgi:phosphocarrier protein HPr